MIRPDKKSVLERLKTHNVVPLYKEIMADFETPVSVYYKTAGKDYSFLLESVEGGEKMGRYSFIGIRPYAVIRSSGGKAWTEKEGQKTPLEGDDPFRAVSAYLKKFKPYDEKSLPRFHAGAVGYVGYDMVRFFELVSMRSRSGIFQDDILLMIPEVVVAFDHVRHSVLLISSIICEEGTEDPLEKYQRALHMLSSTERDFFSEEARPPSSLDYGTDEEIPFDSNFKREDFEKAVENAKAYITAGDVIQVVLSQSLKVKEKVSPFDFYRALRIVNPPPYMYYLNFGPQKIAGASPEILVRLEGGKVVIRPIAGTRPRGKSEAEDEALSKELLADEKERAEHIMLVDLARNDIGRVCRKGTVKVEDLMYIEKYSHVMHIVSNVTGELKEECDAFDLFRACFPAGTVSGAPKVRAMQIIEELEPTLRGPYAGSICYFNFNGNLDSAITIRTAYFKDDAVTVQAGAGIVADSVPAREYEETLNKAKALLKAFVLAKGMRRDTDD